MAKVKLRQFLLTLTAGISMVAVLAGVWAAESILNQNASEYFEYPRGKEIERKAEQKFKAVIERKSINAIAIISERVTKEQREINEFSKARIVYDFGEDKEIVDSSIINNWLVYENGKILLDEEQVKQYVKALADKYNTVGREREFVNSHGKTVIVSGGPYGWEIDCDKESEELIELIKNKKSEIREPEYKSTAMVKGRNDIGHTYVEISILEQRMWFYKEGELVTDTNIVTGSVMRGFDTPCVVGYIHNKIRNTNLVGADYVSFVRYWMKVYGGIGIHDAGWRNKFGGDIYKTSGSHGCINTPYDRVKTIYDNIEVGTPVIIFNE